MKKYAFLLCAGMFFLSINASVTAYFNYAVFNIPGNSPFIETYLTIIGGSVKQKKLNNGYQGSVNVKVVISDGLNVIKSNSYNLLSPVNKDTLTISSFIDNQRYSLSNGTYTLEITLSDNNAEKTTAFTHKEIINVNFEGNRLSGSSIQPLESFSKTNTPNTISKSGYDLIPYNVNFYPKNQNKLAFYFETYNTDTVLGKNKNFIYSYFIERKEDLFKPQGVSGFKKQITAKVNPLLSQLDISQLESGNYYLVIQLKDEKNILQYEKKWFFQRSNIIKTNDSIKVKQSVNEFFGNFNNADSLKMFVECLWPISTEQQREWQINQAVKKDPELMKKYIIDFWQNRAADSVNPLQMWLSYYKQVVEVNKSFKCGKQKGYYTDRGRVYLQYGAPNQRVVQNSESYSYPYEIWQYYRIQDQTNQQFYTNKKFVFVNKNIADDCYKLIHSDMRGEVYNERWQYEVSKRDESKNTENPKQGGTTFGTNADDFFNNPR